MMKLLTPLLFAIQLSGSTKTNVFPDYVYLDKIQKDRQAGIMDFDDFLEEDDDEDYGFAYWNKNCWLKSKENHFYTGRPHNHGQQEGR